MPYLPGLHPSKPSLRVPTGAGIALHCYTAPEWYRRCVGRVALRTVQLTGRMQFVKVHVWLAEATEKGAGKLKSRMHAYAGNIT